MKILHILDHSIPLHSGYTFRTRAILAQQAQLGWQTFQVTSPKHAVHQADVEEVDGFTFYRSKVLSNWQARCPLLNQWLVVQNLAQRLDQIIPQLKPDVLHAHSPVLNGLAALQMSKKYRLPLVYECRAFWEDAAVDHGTTQEGSLRYRLSRALETRVFKQADAVTTICEGLRNDIKNRGIPEAKITVIPNAVDISQFAFGASADGKLQHSLKLAGNIVLGFIGSFYAYEGLLLLLDALPAILQRQPNVKLLLVGGGLQETEIRTKIAALGLENQVVLTGRVPHDEVQRYYTLVDILVYPRLPMRLTELVTPLKPLEAMAQGRIVVASDVGGHRELIEHGKTGYLFKAGDANTLAGTVLDLLDKQSQWQAVRIAGRQYVEQVRNWQNSAAGYQAVYESVLAKNPR